MNELVMIKRNNVFTNSLIIAEGTNNEHRAVRRLIEKYENDLKDFGKVCILNAHLETKGGKQEISYYQLNEQQATFLMTLLRNNKTVVAFKKELVKQFYQMRQILLEKQTVLWQNTRIEAKVNRLKETNEIKLLVEYAKDNGSKNADKYYITFSKLANKAVGLDSSQRNTATTRQLNHLILIEHIISHVIKEGLEKQLNYKEIYKSCKERIEQFKHIAYLGQIA